jgi:hypothetical protein
MVRVPVERLLDQNVQDGHCIACGPDVWCNCSQKKVKESQQDRVFAGSLVTIAQEHYFAPLQSDWNVDRRAGHQNLRHHG